MKGRTKFLFILLASLFVFTTASAYTGVEGTVYWGDSGTEPWTHGGTIRAIDCEEFNFYLNASYSDGTINSLWDAIPDNGIHICVTILFNDGGNGKPQTQLLGELFIQDDTTQSGKYPLGIIYTGTGPTAIELRNLTASSAGANPWLAGAIVVGALALVSGGMVALRKQRK
jgi:hypothetical protein